MIGIQFYNYKSHFPRHIMYYDMSSRRGGWCFILGVLTTCYSSVTVLHNISINVCSLFWGVAGRQPLQGYRAPPNSFITLNQLIYLYALVVNLEIGNKYHIISVSYDNIRSEINNKKTFYYWIKISIKLPVFYWMLILV